MKFVIAMLILAVSGFWFGAAGAASSTPTDRSSAGDVRVVLIGASIGQEWNLPGLPKRLHLTGYKFEALQEWEYDKSKRLEETLMRPERKFHLTASYFKGFFKESPKPADIVVLKECSSYFPGDTSFEKKKEMMINWVREVKAKKIRAVVATVVPVTRQRAAQDSGKLKGLLAYNDWLREFARKEDLPLLDLEAALRTDDRERYLRDDLTSGDGSHLNRKAYDILDRVMAEAMCRIHPGDVCAKVSETAK